MPEQRVSDERLAAFVRNTHERTIVDDMADDLRDARARLAALEPVVRAAIAEWRYGDGALMSLGPREAVGALPEALRKEFEA